MLIYGFSINRFQKSAKKFRKKVFFLENNSLNNLIWISSNKTLTES